MKIDRIIAIILLLLERDKVSAKTLAEMFEVSTRTIYRDVDTITMAGIPIVAYRGSEGGIGILENYKIRNHFFSVQEIVTMLYALQSIPEEFSKSQIMATLTKVKHLIPEEQYQKIEDSLHIISIDSKPWMSQDTSSYFRLCMKGIEETKLITFTYRNRQFEKSQRMVEPYHLIAKDSQWYIQGFCLEKQDFRVFKLVRMTDLQVSNTIFTKREFAPISFDGNWIKPKLFTITLKAKIELKEKMLKHCKEEDFIEQKDGYMLVKHPFTEDTYGYQLLLSYGELCEVISPEHIRDTFISKVKNILSLYI